MADCLPSLLGKWRGGGNGRSCIQRTEDLFLQILTASNDTSVFGIYKKAGILMSPVGKNSCSLEAKLYKQMASEHGSRLIHLHFATLPSTA